MWNNYDCDDDDAHDDDDERSSNACISNNADDELDRHRSSIKFSGANNPNYNDDDITEASSIGWGTFRQIAENARRILELDSNDPAEDDAVDWPTDASAEEGKDDHEVAIPSPPPIILRGEKDDEKLNSQAYGINRSGGVVLGSTTDPAVLSRAREIIRQRGEERLLQQQSQLLSPSFQQGRHKHDGISSPGGPDPPDAMMTSRLSSTSQRPFNSSMRNQLHSSNSYYSRMTSGGSVGSMSMMTNGSVLTDEMTELELKLKIRRLQQQLLIKHGGFQLGKLVENIQKGGSILLPTVNNDDVGIDDHDSLQVQQISSTTNEQRQIQQMFIDRSQLHLQRQQKQRQSAPLRQLSLDTIGEDYVNNDNMANPIVRNFSSAGKATSNRLQNAPSTNDAISKSIANYRQLSKQGEESRLSRDGITSSMRMQSRLASIVVAAEEKKEDKEMVVASIGSTVKKQREQSLSNHFQHQRLHQTTTKQAEILQLPPIHPNNNNSRRSPPRFFSTTSPQSPSSPLSVTSSSNTATPERDQKILAHRYVQVPSMPTNSNRVNSPAAPCTPQVSPSRSDHSADNVAGGSRGVTSSHRCPPIDPPPSIPLISVPTSSPRSVAASSPRSVAQNVRINLDKEEEDVDEEEEEDKEAISTNSTNDHSAASAHVDTLSSSSGSRSAEEKDQIARERLQLMKEQRSSIRSTSTSSLCQKGHFFGIGDATSSPTKEKFERSLAANLPTMINLQALSRLQLQKQQMQQFRSSSAITMTMIDNSKSFESRNSLNSAPSFEHGVQPTQSFANSIQPSVESECVRQNATLFDLMSEDNKDFFISAATEYDGPNMSAREEAYTFEDIWLKSAANVLNPLIEDEENTSSSEEHEIPPDCSKLHYDCDDSKTNSTRSSDTKMQSQPRAKEEEEEEEQEQEQQQDIMTQQSGGAGSPSLSTYLNLITSSPSHEYDDPSTVGMNSLMTEESSIFSSLPIAPTSAPHLSEESRIFSDLPSVAQVMSRMTAAPQTKNVGASVIASRNKNLATFLNQFSNGLLRGCTQLDDNESSVVFSSNFELVDDGLLENNVLKKIAAASSYPSIHTAPTTIQSNKCEKIADSNKFGLLNTQQAKTNTYPSVGCSSNAAFSNIIPNLSQPLTAKERARNRKQDTTPLRTNASLARSTMENIATVDATTMTSINVVKVEDSAELGRIVESKDLVRFYDEIKLTRECDKIRPNIVKVRSIVSKDSRDDDSIDSPDSSLLAGISETDQHHEQGNEACIDSQVDAADDMECDASTISAQFKFTENIKMTSRELYKGHSLAWHSSNGVNDDEQYNSKQWSSLRADRAAQLAGKLSLFSLSIHGAQLQEHSVNVDATSRDSANPLHQSTYKSAAGDKHGCMQDEDEKSIGYTHDDFIRDFHTILDNGRNITLDGSANDYAGQSHGTNSSNDYLPSSLRKVTLPDVDTLDGFDLSRKRRCQTFKYQSHRSPNEMSKSLLEEKLRSLSGGVAKCNQGDNSIGTSDLGSLYTKASERSQSIMPVPSTIFHRTYPNSSARSSPSSIANTYNGELFMARSLLPVAKKSTDDDDDTTEHNQLNPSKLFESNEYNDDVMDSKMRQVQNSTTYEYEDFTRGNDVWPKNIKSQVKHFFSAIHLVDSDQEQTPQLRSNPTMDSTVLAENKMAERPPLHKSGTGEFVLHQVKSKAIILKAEKLRNNVLTRDSSDAADHIPDAVLSSPQSLGQSSFTAANHNITARPRSLLSDKAMLQVKNADVILSHQHKKREEVAIAFKQLVKTSTADRQNPSSTTNQLQTLKSLNKYIQSSPRVADEASIFEAFEVAPLRSFAAIGKISKHNGNKAFLNDLGVHHAVVKRGHDVVASQQHASTKKNPKPTTISVTPMNNADIHKRPPLVSNTENNKDQTQVKNGRRKTAHKEVMKDRIRLRWKKLVGGEGALTPRLPTHTTRNNIYTY